MRVHIVIHVFSRSKFHVLQTCFFLVEMLLTYFWDGINIRMNATQHSFPFHAYSRDGYLNTSLETISSVLNFFFWQGLKATLPIYQYWNRRWVVFALSTFGHGKNFPRRLCFCQFLQINLLTEKAMSILRLSSFSRHHFQPLKKINWTYVALKKMYI